MYYLISFITFFPSSNIHYINNIIYFLHFNLDINIININVNINQTIYKKIFDYIFNYLFKKFKKDIVFHDVDFNKNIRKYSILKIESFIDMQ